MYKSIFSSHTQQPSENTPILLTLEHELLACDVLDEQADLLFTQESIMVDGAERLETLYTECKEAIDAGQCTPVLMDQFVKRAADITQGTLVLRDMTEESFSDEVDRNKEYEMTNESLSDSIADIWKAIKKKAGQIWDVIMGIFSKIFENYTALHKTLTTLKKYFDDTTDEFDGPIDISGGYSKLHVNGLFSETAIGDAARITKTVRDGLGKLSIQYNKTIAESILVDDPKNLAKVSQDLIDAANLINADARRAEKHVFPGGYILSTTLIDNPQNPDPVAALIATLPNITFEVDRSINYNSTNLNVKVSDVRTLLSDAVDLTDSLMEVKATLKEIDKNRKKVVDSFDGIINKLKMGKLGKVWTKGMINVCGKLINSRLTASYKKVTTYEFGLCRAAAAFGTDARNVLEAAK